MSKHYLCSTKPAFVKIEEAIHQKQPFNSSHQKAVVNLLYTHSWLMEKSKEFLALWDITPQQYNILRILRGAGHPISTCVIRERLLDRMSDTPRMVERMVAKQLVIKSLNRTDKRLVDVSITEKGINILRELDKRENEMSNILGKLDAEEALLLSNLLDKIRS